jgi:hypothetical protein
VPWLRRLVVGLSPRRPGSLHVRFVVDRVALGQVFFPRGLRFLVSITPPSPSVLVYHLGDEHHARWWPQFRDIASPHLHEQQQQQTATNRLDLWVVLCDGVRAFGSVCKEVGLEINSEKSRNMLMSRCKKAGQKHSIKIGNMSSEDVVQFKYLGSSLANQNCMNRA